MMEKIDEHITHYINVESVEQERALCQKNIILQYDERKIDEKKLALKLKDLRQYSDTAKNMIGSMQELCDNI
jgi:hypothetical protein